MNGADTKAPGGGGPIPGMIGCDRASVPIMGSKITTFYLSVVVRNVNKTLFALFIWVMRDGWRTRWRHVTGLLRWLLRQRREHVCVSLAIIRPHRS